MCILISSTTFVCNISYSVNNPVRYRHKRTQASTWSTRYSRQILIKLIFSQEILKNLKYEI